ncbi:MAG: ADP-ribosylglycohydrolase [Clostridia bacterium]|nr:ADP-ribosylglycohydrolase [Clostridia bacterium]
MLGAIIGDIVGSRFEFHNHRSKSFELFTPGCNVTDDSIMTLAVAQAIMDTVAALGSRGVSSPAGPADATFVTWSDAELLLLSQNAVRAMQRIGRQYPDCGYGGHFAVWMFTDQPRPYHSFGNGAAMRISPVGFFARTEAEVKRLSQAVTAVTHDHPEGLKGSEATALAIFLARQGRSKDEIRQRIITEYYPLDFTIDQIRPTYHFNETCQETVPQAIEAFLESESFEDAIRTAISVGGDSDTLAAITGAMAEAYYGVPDAIRSQALTFLDEQLRAIFDRWDQR